MAVLDTAWNPFRPNMLATGSVDGSVGIWHIPDGGLTENMNEPLTRLKGHAKKVTFTVFHPTSENVLATTSADKSVCIWDIEKSTPALKLKGSKWHGGACQDLKWNDDGSLMLTSCSDKKSRILDPRADAVATKFAAHNSVKASKGCWLNVWNKFITCGATKQARRELKFWDHRNTSKPIESVGVDSSGGVLLPYFDKSTKLLYLSGKGDGNIRIYETVEGSPHQYLASNFSTRTSATGIFMCPKASVDVLACETTRFVKLEKEGPQGKVSELKFIIPRKSEDFQEDLFPDDYAGKPAQDADAYFAGKDVAPVLMNMDPEERGEEAAASGVAFTAKKVAAPRTVEEVQAELNAANAEVRKLQKEVADLEAKLSGM